MLTVRAIYKEGKIILPNEIAFDKPVDVLVTFLEDIEISGSEKTPPQKFSFRKSRALFKGCKGFLSQAVIEERRDEP